MKDEYRTEQVRRTLRPGLTAEQELDALAGVYRFILFESRASKKPAAASRPDDAEGRSSDGADTIIPDSP